MLCQRLGKGSRRCLSTQRLLPDFPSTSFPKQTGGFFQVSHSQSTAGFAVCFLQGEEQASALLWGKKRLPLRVCVCLSVTQASKYSTMVKASKWQWGRGQTGLEMKKVHGCRRPCCTCIAFPSQYSGWLLLVPTGTWVE